MYGKVGVLVGWSKGEIVYGEEGNVVGFSYVV